MLSVQTGASEVGAQQPRGDIERCYVRITGRLGREGVLSDIRIRVEVLIKSFVDHHHHFSSAYISQWSKPPFFRLYSGGAFLRVRQSPWSSALSSAAGPICRPLH